MNIIISNASGVPIYEQIYMQIKNSIVSGELHEGDALPSIRVLAKDLRISIITTKRAYDELDKDGYIYTVAAKGCYVAEKNAEIMREEHLKRIEMLMDEIIRLSPACNLSESDLIEMLRAVKKEGKV